MNFHSAGINIVQLLFGDTSLGSSSLNFSYY